MERIDKYDSMLNDENIENIKNIIENKIQPYYDYFIRFDIVDYVLYTNNDKCFMLLFDNLIRRYKSLKIMFEKKLIKHYCVNASKIGSFSIVKNIIDVYDFYGLTIKCLDVAIYEKWKLFYYSFIKNDIIENKRKKLTLFVKKICRIIPKNKIICYKFNMANKLLRSKKKHESIIISNKLQYINYILNHYYL